MVGNKCDVKNRQVSQSEGMHCSVKYGASYEEISLKNEIDVDHLLLTLLDMIKLREYQNMVEKNYNVEIQPENNDVNRP